VAEHVLAQPAPVLKPVISDRANFLFLRFKIPSVADPDTDGSASFWELDLDPDPHKSGTLDPDPQLSENRNRIWSIKVKR
jgi:hypothetical protein